METLEILGAFEKQFPAKLLATLGSNAWPFIKNRVVMSTMDSAIRLDTGNARRLFTWQGVKLVASSAAHLIHISLRRRGKPAFFGASTGIASGRQTAFKDYYFPYHDLVPQDCQYFVNCGNLDHLSHHIRYLSDQHVVIDNYLMAPWRKILGLLMACWPASSLPPFSAMAAFLSEHQISVSAEQLRRSFAEFRAGALLYSLLFRITRPTRIYVVSAYSKGDLVAAARRRGIRTIEIQHGILGRFHPGYNYSDPDARLGAPDQVDVYNEFWKDELIAGKFFREDQVRIVGRLKYQELPAADPSLARTIVFTGQAAYRDELMARFQQWNSTLIEQGYTLLYVPHPKETPAERAGMRDHLLAFGAVGLYEGGLTTEHLIKSAAAHLSLFSACHFDAVHLIGKTFVLDGDWSEFMNPYVGQHPNRFIRVRDIDGIIHQLNGQLSDQ